MRIFKKLIFVSFLAIIFSLVVASLFTEEASNKYFYQAPWFKFFWFIFSIGIIIAFVSSLKRKDFSSSIIYLGFLLVLLAGLLTSLLEEEGFIEMKKGQTQDTFWIDDVSWKSLGFSLSLKDFSVEFYPEGIGLPKPLKEGPYPQAMKGMRFVKRYRSLVSITKDNNILKEGAIEVNRPLGFGGFIFYQYGYDPDFPDQTIFQVVKDPGVYLAYTGYLFLLLGIIFSFKSLWKL